VSEELRNALSRIINSGYQLSADGFEFLRSLSQEELAETVKKALRGAGLSTENITILDRNFLENVSKSSKEDKKGVLIGANLIVRPLADQHEAEIQVLNEQNGNSTGDFDSFLNYFRNRFNKIEKILRSRLDMKDAMSISSILKMPLGSKAKVIGLITDKRASGSRLFVELEDAEDSITIMASDSEIVRSGLSILKDQVICVDALKYKQDLLIANEFIWPDIPSKPARRSEIPFCAAFLSDVHVGSVHFKEELFKRFVRWLNMEVGPPPSRMLASRVKYIIIAGDLVDGIGVYPNQINELNITDIRNQYVEAANLLSGIPDYIEIIVLPGNHDAVRKSLPQPPITEEYAESLCKDNRVHMLKNPSRLLLHGVETYISHGKALDEILSQVPGLNFQNPVKGIELLLRCRHVAPTYGSSTPLAPEKEDRLVIGNAPDILQMGHIHVHGVKKYKGTTMISSGSWQDQTPFQKRMNLLPTTGVAPIVDLQTHMVVPLDFNKLG
jgi:DNA polymerase II small subunit